MSTLYLVQITSLVSVCSCSVAAATYSASARREARSNTRHLRRIGSKISGRIDYRKRDLRRDLPETCSPVEFHEKSPRMSNANPQAVNLGDTSALQSLWILHDLPYRRVLTIQPRHRIYRPVRTWPPPKWLLPSLWRTWRREG